MAEYIEREALLALETFMQDSDGFEHSCVLSVDIRSCKAADVVEVRHGRWIKDEKASENHVEAIYICSACQNWEAWGETEKTNYCPNCGARMDGE